MVIIPKLRDAGAKKIHLRLTAPPPRFPCFMGMAMAKPGELLATNRTDEDLKSLLRVDTFRYLSTKELKEFSRHGFLRGVSVRAVPLPYLIEGPDGGWSAACAGEGTSKCSRGHPSLYP